jgi:hypothetical protein
MKYHQHPLDRRHKHNRTPGVTTFVLILTKTHYMYSIIATVLLQREREGENREENRAETGGGISRGTAGARECISRMRRGRRRAPYVDGSDEREVARQRDRQRNGHTEDLRGTPPRRRGAPDYGRMNRVLLY